MTNPIFNPPLYIQRYQFVIDFVKKNKPKKVVDLGCNDCTLLKKLKFHREIELLAGVDIDCAVMRDKMYALAPMPTDYLQPGEDPLTIEVYQGSVTERDPRTKGFDLVTSIELIEHLQLDDVARFSEVVFGYMAPAAAIISTPNADFNPLLPGLTGFRHYDHKFEWTRTEFQTWALQVCREFGYVVEFTGVGEAPGHQEESVGFCSQIGVFYRDRTADEACLESDGTEDAFPYRLLYDVVYPSMRDNNIRQSTVVNEVLYWAEHLRREWLEETAGEGEERRGWQEETAGEEEEASTYRQTGEEEEEGFTRERMEREEGQIEGEEERTPVEEDGRGVEKEEAVEVNGEEEAGDRRIDGGQEELYRQGGSVCVPLARLWSCCPKVQALSGMLQHLRDALLEDPRVRLTTDSTAVMLVDGEEGEDDEDLDWDYENKPARSDTGPFLVGTMESEDWDAEL